MMLTLADIDEAVHRARELLPPPAVTIDGRKYFVIFIPSADAER